MNATSFKAGQSGNRRGRPPGSGNRSAFATIEAEGGKVARRVIAAAMAGDIGAARLVMDVVALEQRERPVKLAARMNTRADARSVMVEAFGLVADGAMTVSEATRVAELAHAFVALDEATAADRQHERATSPIAFKG